MFRTKDSEKYSKIKHKDKHMEKDIHSSTDSDDDDERKYIKQ